MPTWDPEQYHRFGDERSRPARDLVARVQHPDPRLVVDLGCGTGALARILAARWPGARVVGVDHSAEMLARAAEAEAAIEWVDAGLAAWEPPDPVDVLVSNAALHWVPDHRVLIPALLEHISPGGVLAFQVPLSFGEPSHVAMRELLETGAPDGGALGTEELRARMNRPWVLPPEEYGDLLAPLATEVDVWETRYHHRLQGEDAVFQWVSGTGLRPVLEGLSGEELAVFLPAYRERLEQEYPPRVGEEVVFPFPRLFVVARR